MMKLKYGFFVVWALVGLGNAGESQPLVFNDPAPQRYHLHARASQIDSRVAAHPTKKPYFSFIIPPLQRGSVLAPFY
jgi:hypothetical protein